MKIVIALDWTPNVIHAGLLLALHQGKFAEAGLEIEYISTEIDQYTKKPIRRLIDGEVDLAIGPAEHLFTFGLLDNKAPDLQALATVMQQDLSAFIVKNTAGISRPKELDHCTYLGYNTPLEEHLLTSMIRNDGGAGIVEMKTLPRLEVFDAFLKDLGQVCWVFLPWEGVMAQQQGFSVRSFKLNEFKVPYGYSTLFYGRKKDIEENKEVFKKFFDILAEGYKDASRQPEASASYLCEKADHQNFRDKKMISEAMKMIAPAFLTPDKKWGLMAPNRFDDYVQWLLKKGFMEQKEAKLIMDYAVFTNRFLCDW